MKRDHRIAFILLVAVAVPARAGSLAESQRSEARPRCLANLEQKGVTGQPAETFCDCLVGGLDTDFTSAELGVLFGNSESTDAALTERLKGLYDGCSRAAAEAARFPTSYSQSAIAAVLFVPAAFVSSMAMGFGLSLLNLIGLGVAGLAGLAGNWIAKRFGVANPEGSVAERFNTGMYVFTWAGPVYLISQVLIFLLQATGITFVTGLFIHWFPGAQTTLQILGFLWLWMSIGISGLLAYAVVLWILKIWLGSLGIFWALMDALFSS